MAALRYMSGRELETRRTQRTEKLEWIEQQIATGDLVIRQATAQERARYGIAPEAGTRRTRARPAADGRPADDAHRGDVAA
jgi:hypothetical protein